MSPRRSRGHGLWPSTSRPRIERSVSADKHADEVDAAWAVKAV